MALNPTFTFGAINLTAFPFSVRAGSADRGAPEQVVATVQSALRDGSLTEVTRYENRTVTFEVLIEGPTLQAIAASEALLVAEAAKARNEFVFNPGDGSSFDAVFLTFEADLRPSYNEDFEAAFLRAFTLTFEAYPWPRSATKVVTPAVALAVASVVNAGSATTGWTSTNGTVTVVSGAVVSSYNAATPSGGFYGTNLILTSTFSTATDKYIAVDWKSSVPAYQAFKINGAAGQLTEVRREPLAASYIRSWYKVDDSVTSVTSIRLDTAHSPGTGTQTLSIDQVQKAATLPASGTTKQKSAIIKPGGSVPTQGDVIVQHATAGLGKTIVFSHPAGGGYSPPLRQWLFSSSTPAPNAGWVSGAVHSLDTITEYRVPNSALPEGATQLWILAACNAVTSVNLSWSIYAAVNGVTVGGTVISGTTTLTFPAVAPNYYLFPICAVPLPIAKSGPAGITRIELQAGNATNPIVYVDEAYLFATDRGRLTVVDLSEGTPSSGSINNRLKVTAPSLTDPNGAIMVGTAADWSDSYVIGSTAIQCDQVGHLFDPQGSVIFTMTRGANDAAVSLEHYPRWHTNPAS